MQVIKCFKVDSLVVILWRWRNFTYWRSNFKMSWRLFVVKLVLQYQGILLSCHPKQFINFIVSHALKCATCGNILVLLDYQCASVIFHHYNHRLSACTYFWPVNGSCANIWKINQRPSRTGTEWQVSLHSELFRRLGKPHLIDMIHTEW